MMDSCIRNTLKQLFDSYHCQDNSTNNFNKHDIFLSKFLIAAAVIKNLIYKIRVSSLVMFSVCVVGDHNVSV